MSDIGLQGRERVLPLGVHADIVLWLYRVFQVRVGPLRASLAMPEGPGEPNK